MPRDILFRYHDSALVSDDEIVSIQKKFTQYRSRLQEGVQEKMYTSGESALHLPFDEPYQAEVKEVAQKAHSKNLKYIFVLGIGGSNLGSQAIFEAIVGRSDPYLAARSPKMIFLDTVSSRAVLRIEQLLKHQISDPAEFIINVISKSGTTTETIANFEAIISSCLTRFGDAVFSRIVVTTDQDSKLWNQALERGLHLLRIPKNVGGRYSVFSAVGLFPLMLAGMDTDALCEGARQMSDRSFGDGEQDIAAISAACTFSHYQQSIRINNHFFFHPDFEPLGKWYRQLVAESLGKEHDISGNAIHAGITPLISIGSTDLHSMLQLYLSRPKDMLTQFVFVSQDHDREVSLPQKLFFPDLVEHLEGKNMSQVMSAIYEGVKQTYQNEGLPFTEVILPEISEHTLGQYMQWKMMEVMYLAHLLGVNAFDQPKVEGYKAETRRILAGL